MQDLLIDIKTMPQAFRGYHILLVITYNQTNFKIALPLRDLTLQIVAEALSGLSPFQLVFLRDPPNFTSLSFPKIDTIPVKNREYYNLLLATAQLVGNFLLEWRLSKH